MLDLRGMASEAKARRVWQRVWLRFLKRNWGKWGCDTLKYCLPLTALPKSYGLGCIGEGAPFLASGPAQVLYDVIKALGSSI